MNAPFLLILTGPPGAGKTTTATLIAEHFTPSVVIEADALWAHVVRGSSNRGRRSPTFKIARSFERHSPRPLA